MNKNKVFLNEYNDLVDGDDFDILMDKKNKKNKRYKINNTDIHDKIIKVIDTDMTELDGQTVENYFGGKKENEVIDSLTNDDLIITVSELIRLIRKYVNNYELSLIIYDCYNNWSYFEIIRMIIDISDWYKFCNIKVED
jgi:hypothetical protein